MNVKNIFTSHIDKKTFLTFLFLTTYLYTFSLYENPSLIIFSAVTEYISIRYWYRNINFSILFGKVVSEEKIFRNRPFRNKNCLWWDEMSNLYREHYNYASNQYSVYLGKQFQRRRFF